MFKEKWFLPVQSNKKCSMRIYLYRVHNLSEYLQGHTHTDITYIYIYIYIYIHTQRYRQTQMHSHTNIGK